MPVSKGIRHKHKIILKLYDIIIIKNNLKEVIFMEKSRVRIKIGKNELEIEGNEDFVKEEIEKLFEKIEWRREEKQIEEDSRQVENKKVEENQFNESDKDEVNYEKPYIKDFANDKNPSSNQEKALVLAYYLKKYEGKEKFGVEDIKELWIVSEFKPPKYIKQTLRDVKNKKRWFERVDSGIYELTMHGEHFVKRELPKSE